MTIPIPTGPPPRRPLGPGLVAFIIVDVVLVVGVVVAAFVLLGGDRGGPQASPRTTSPGSSTTAASPAPSPSTTGASERPGGTDQRFASPSGNIVCDITSAGARCGIASLAQKPAPIDGCDGSVGFVYVVDETGKVDVPCVPKKELPKKAGKDVNVLGYGQTSSAYGFTCTSDEQGMACVDEVSGSGFQLARAGGRVV